MKPSSRRDTGPGALILRTTWGDLRVESRHGFVAACTLPRPPAAASTVSILGEEIHADNSDDRAALRAAARFVRGLLAGKPAPLPPLEIPRATPFTIHVWKALLAIPPGETRTYGELAHRVGKPRAARAVGTACGANQIPLFIPCHRVVAQGGALGGFSAGLPWKVVLLRCEGARP